MVGQSDYSSTDSRNLLPWPVRTPGNTSGKPCSNSAKMFPMLLRGTALKKGATAVQ